MPYDTDGLVGKLALQKGLVNPAQLKECLSEQAALHAAGQKRPLGVIMVSRGLMKDEDLLDLLEEQRRYLADRANYTQVRREDFLFGQILIKQGAASSDDVNRALRAQAEAAERGEVPVPRLGQILMDLGISDETTVQQTLRLQYKTLFECPGCTLKYNLVEADPGKQYRCKKCGAILAPKPPGGGVKADESAYGLKLEVADDVPPEVTEAEKDEKSKFDKYVLLAQIGRGGAGTVYRAYQKELKRTVAIKVLRGGDDETVRRFAREAQTAAGLKHPNIVSVYEIGSWHNVSYLTMEYIDGRPLDDLGPVPVKKACQILRDVAMAIHYAHQKGVVHRDLKPQNILIDQEGRAYVTDFGLARDVSGGKDLTLEGIVVGTPAYMSPEQARGERRLDGRSDVASLGAVLYELLTGHQPYSGETPMDIAVAVIQKDPVPPRRVEPTVPSDLEAVCLKAMEKDPARRYLTARAFAEDLQRFLEGDAVLARSPSMVRVTLRRLGRYKVASALSIAAIVIACAALGVVFSVTRESRARATLIEARDLEHAGRLEEALRLYEAVPGSSPDTGRVRSKLNARLDEARRESEWKAAVEIMGRVTPQLPPARRAELATQALERFPEYEEAYAARAQAHEDAGDERAAYDDLGRAVAVSRNPLPYHLARAEIARRLGNLADEIASLSLALEIQSLSVDLTVRRAAASTQLARKFLAEGTAEGPRRMAPLLVSADQDLARAGRHAPAEDAGRDLAGLFASIAGSPARRDVAAALAEVALKDAGASRLDPARRAANRALEVDPGCALAFAARGLCLYESALFREARAEARRALEADPALPEAFAIRGLSRVRESMIEMAGLKPPPAEADPPWAVDFVEGCVDLRKFLARAARRQPSALDERASAAPREAPEALRRYLSTKLVDRALQLRERGEALVASGLIEDALAIDPSRPKPGN